MKRKIILMKLKKGDFVIVGAVLLLAVSVWVFGFSGSTEGSRAEIFEDGKLIYTVPLYENREIEVSGCIVAVSDGEVRMLSADCPDKVCEKTGAISEGGEIIVCAPNRISIKVTGEAAIDAYVS